MEVYRRQIVVPSDGTLTLKGLPFRPGDSVEIVVRSCGRKRTGGEPYSLRGKPIRYVDPFESVAEEDWEVLR